jgi:hypothetical protein
MNELLEKLEKVLLSEVDIHTAMVTSSRDFNNAIKEGNVENIKHQQSLHDEAICKIERLEEQRIGYCSKAAEILGITRKPLRLATVSYTHLTLPTKRIV